MLNKSLFVKKSIASWEILTFFARGFFGAFESSSSEKRMCVERIISDGDSSIWAVCIDLTR